jgi:hypothetical protein
MTAYIIRIRADWLRVPLWSLWWPLVLVPDFTRWMVWHGYTARLFQAGCWDNMIAYYLIGLEGTLCEEPKDTLEE